jgi:hypothetical protein
VPTPGFSTVLERSGRGLSGEVVGILVDAGPVRCRHVRRPAAGIILGRIFRTVTKTGWYGAPWYPAVR